MDKLKTTKDISNRDIRSSLEFNKTLSDRIALFITGAFGSIQFLCFCLFIFLLWILCNMGFIPQLLPFDPYPFPALVMAVSLFAIILSISVLITQNRVGKMEKIRQQVEFEVNVRAENEITKVLQMLHDIQKKMGIIVTDTELETMKQNIDLHDLHREMNKDKKKDK